MWFQARRRERLIRTLHLEGTVYAQLIRHPEAWADFDELDASPALGRYVADLRDALIQAGWTPGARRRPRSGRRC